MEASAGLFAGSHIRNEVVVIRGGCGEPKQVRYLEGKVCEICGDMIVPTVDGDFFVACNECGFPVCRPCYDYERREGTQVCPHCKTHYKRLKGSPRVEGAEEEDEDDFDDLENEFILENGQKPESDRGTTEAVLSVKKSRGWSLEDNDWKNTTRVTPDIINTQSRHINADFPWPSHGDHMLPSSIQKCAHACPGAESGSGRWVANGGWRERMEEWKLEHGNLQPDPDDEEENMAL